MLKRIEKSQVRIGMFIEAVEGTWTDSPFKRRRFLLESEAELASLLTSNLSGVYINTAKGADASGSAQIASTDVKANTKTTANQIRRREIAMETQAVRQCSDRLKGIFDLALNGGAPSLPMTAPIVNHINSSVAHDPWLLLSVTRLKKRDETTFLHSIAVSALMLQFARHLELEENLVRILGVAGLLHDIGKVTIPIEVLSKAGVLSDDEMGIIKTHPKVGYDILLREGSMPEIVLDICLNHHERPDGKGYPNNVGGEALSQYARMAAICDVYEAITSARPYKKPWPASEAVAWMMQRQGHFDQDLLKEFISGVLRLS